jgi:hypothetical protein
MKGSFSRNRQLRKRTKKRPLPFGDVDVEDAKVGDDFAVEEDGYDFDDEKVGRFNI